MNYNQLSLEQAPDISTPLRFFLSAPLFAFLAFCLLMYQGPEILSNRWSPQTLAFTHLVTLGFITMSMVGALFQLLPVLAGASIPRSSQLSLVTHLLFSCGVLLLAAGFAFEQATLLKLSIIVLIPGLLIFLLATSYALINAQSSHASINSMRIAIFSLWITATLGLLLASGHALDAIPLLRQFTPLHIGWGTLGWISVMIISVAYQVVPMFQITFSYPKLMTRLLSPSILIALILWSAYRYTSTQVSIPGEAIDLGFFFLFFCIMLSFALFTLKLEAQRKKRLADTTLYFWMTGLSCLGFSLVVLLYAEFFDQELSILVGILFFFGFAISIINGMLYKIIPFLVWLHLHRKLAFSSPRGRSGIPTMNEVINNRQSMRQYWLHLLALVLSIATITISTKFFYMAILVWLANYALLFIHIFRAILTYRHCLGTK
ncbi:MAG: hypothetical protein OEY43_08535 [Gammaproteobacteria bacterium]|nr:hypothetical protein [Gammaproteobacteria bacterium]